jgi:hypothetical protein
MMMKMMGFLAGRSLRRRRERRSLKIRKIRRRS